MSDVSCVVLAGGKSLRLGVDKSLLKIDGEWLLQGILRQLAALSDDLVVAANEREKLVALLQVPIDKDARAHYGTAAPTVRIVPDIHPGLGPLGGIYSGLRSMRYERGLFVGCDMPFLNLALLRYMIQLGRDFDLVIPRMDDETEPLHAVYSKACLPLVAQLLEEGQLRVVHLFPRVRMRYVEQEEIELFDPQHLSFFNINTPADLQRARELWRARSLGASARTNRRPRQ